MQVYRSRGLPRSWPVALKSAGHLPHACSKKRQMDGLMSSSKKSSAVADSTLGRMCGDIHGRGSQSERYRSPETMAGNEEKVMVGWSVEEGNGGERKEWGEG